MAEIGLRDGHAQPQLAVELEPMGTAAWARPRRRWRRRPRRSRRGLVATLVACCDDPHWVSTVVAAVVRGSRRWATPCGDVERLLAHLADAPRDDLAHLGRVDARAGDELGEHAGQQIGGVHRRPAHRCGGRWGSGRLRRSRRRSCRQPWGRPRLRCPRPVASTCGDAQRRVRRRPGQLWSLTAARNELQQQHRSPSMSSHVGARVVERRASSPVASR